MPLEINKAPGKLGMPTEFRMLPENGNALKYIITAVESRKTEQFFILLPIG